MAKSIQMARALNKDIFELINMRNSWRKPTFEEKWSLLSKHSKEQA